MAQYRLSMDYVSRSKGQSAVAKAAYRSGERLEDRRLGTIHDYTRKQGIVYCAIVTPDDDGPDWMQDRAALWNRVEAVENRSNSQVARDIELNLPHELDAATRRSITLEFARHIADTYGFAVDVAIHLPNREGDQRNHHAHLLFATRAVDQDSPTGFVKNKDRRFNHVAMQREGGENVTEPMREKWEEIQNRALERADVRDADGKPVRVDRRSYERQGIDQEPTVKEGPCATALKRRAQYSERAAMNEEILERNALRTEMRQQIADLEQELIQILRKEVGTPAGGVPEVTMTEEEKRLIQEEHMKFRNAFNAFFAEYRTQAEAFQIPRVYNHQFDRNDPHTIETPQQDLIHDYDKDGVTLHRRDAQERQGFEDWLQVQRQVFRQQDAAEIRRQDEAFRHLKGDDWKMHKQAQAQAFEVREQGRAVEQIQIQDQFRDYQNELHNQRFEALNRQMDANQRWLDQAYEQFQRDHQPEPKREAAQEPVRREAARNGLAEMNKQLGLSEKDIEQNRQQRQIWLDNETETHKRKHDFTP